MSAPRGDPPPWGDRARCRVFDVPCAVACGVEEVWIAKPYELLLTHLAQYAPATFITMAKKSAAARMKQTLAAVEHGQK